MRKFFETALLFVLAQVNLALGRPASQSSTFAQHLAGIAVDGDATTTDDNACSITNTGDLYPWWKIELANATWITHVEITNRFGSGQYE